MNENLFGRIDKIIVNIVASESREFWISNELWSHSIFRLTGVRFFEIS
jgi:ribosomal silencing factor RsfS